jgi:hypothetical protein
LLIVRPDLAVSVFDKNVCWTLAAGEIAEHQTVRGVLGDRYAAKFAARAPVKFDNKAFRTQNNVVAAVTVPIVNLARNVVMPVFSADSWVAPSPQNGSIQFLRDRRTGIVHITFVDVPGADDLDFTVGIHVGRHQPLPGIFRIKSNDLPGSYQRRIDIRFSDVFRAEIGKIAIFSPAGHTDDERHQNMNQPYAAAPGHSGNPPSFFPGLSALCLPQS